MAIINDEESKVFAMQWSGDTDPQEAGQWIGARGDHFCHMCDHQQGHELVVFYERVTREEAERAALQAVRAQLDAA